MMSLLGCSMSGWYGRDQPTAASAQSALSGLLYGGMASQTATVTYTTEGLWHQWNTDATAYQTGPVTSPTVLQTVWVRWTTDRETCDYSLSALADDWYVEPCVTTEQERTAQERATTEAVKRVEAEFRAEELLVASLDDQQKQQYLKERSFTVISKDGQRKYRIRTGRSRNIELLDEKGKKIKTYCAHPAEAVPDQDTMLAQKLMIEHAEEEFLRIANAS